MQMDKTNSTIEENKKVRRLLNIEDYHRRAKQILPQMAYDFYRTGSDDQVTLADNQLAYRRIKLRPKIFVDVSSHSPSNSMNRHTKLLNSSVTISFPCIIAPTALHRLANPEHGELATVRAAVTHSTIMCVSTVASTSMESIAEEHRRQIKEHYPQSYSQLWYQLYVFENRQQTQQLIERAERCGYKAIVITVDLCVLGNAQSRNNFYLDNRETNTYTSLHIRKRE
jgi:isopentenyl diphosphate isomerase/L-lactate dehydrogenase-like FMN-dependent dehydrogenase